MPITSWVPQVNQIANGQQVSAQVVNPITDQLVQRDQYLYEKFGDANNLSVLTTFNQPIHPDEVGTIISGNLVVGYYANDIDGQGVRRAVINLSTNATQSIFNPQNSCYPLGIVSNVTGTNTCDLWVTGLINLPTDIDNFTSGLLQPINGSTTETFRVGPYYLSQKYPGKITSNPSGIQVFVGYALSKTQFLLNPNVNQLAQLFINYRFNVLDRPTAAPVLLTAAGSDGVANGTTTFTAASAPFTSNMVGKIITIGGTVYTIAGYTSTSSITLSATHSSATGLVYSLSAWAVPNSDVTRLGWIDINWLTQNNPSALTGLIVPSGALFFYNIPSAYTTDNADNMGAGSLSVDEEAEATELAQALPPQPANFSIITVNGVQQVYRDIYNADGIYTVDNFGIWWYDDADGTQPWSSELATGGWTPADWPTIKGSSESRAFTFLQFAKFNPDFSQSIVTSLAPFDSDANNSSNTIQIVDKVSGLSSAYGDLLLKFNLGFDSNATVSASPTAVSTFVYNPVTGNMVRTLTPIVSTLTGSGGAIVTQSPPNSGNFQISFQSQGTTGQVYDLQPENAELDYLGTTLNSYLRFPYTTQAITYGVKGKIVLPEMFPANQNLYLVLHLVGFSNGASTQQIGFNFSYNVSTAGNVLSGNDTVASPFQISMNPYTLNTAFKYKNASLLIPAASINPDSIVNFRLTRYMFGNSTDYTGDIGLLAVYWSTLAPS